MFSRRKVSLSALQALLPLIAGPAILSFGLYNIHEPCGVTEGGVLGMTLLLHHWLGLSPSASGLVMNLASYLLGMRYLGRGFLKKSLVSAAAFSAFYALWERFPPLLPNLGAWPLAAAIACARAGPAAATTRWPWCWRTAQSSPSGACTLCAM